MRTMRIFPTRYGVSGSDRHRAVLIRPRAGERGTRSPPSWRPCS